MREKSNRFFKYQEQNLPSLRLLKKAKKPVKNMSTNEKIKFLESSPEERILEELIQKELGKIGESEYQSARTSRDQLEQELLNELIEEEIRKTAKGSHRGAKISRGHAERKSLTLEQLKQLRALKKRIIASETYEKKLSPDSRARLEEKRRRR